MITTGNLGIVRLTGEDLKALRLDVFTRDGFRCARCGQAVTWDSGELMHIVSRGSGGSDTMDNTECGCSRCHREEHQPKVVATKRGSND